jgi:hypothetical protein
MVSTVMGAGRDFFRADRDCQDFLPGGEALVTHPSLARFEDSSGGADARSAPMTMEALNVH